MTSERIHKYRRMVDWVVQYWGYRYPNKADDLQGVGYLVLVECANKFEGDEDMFKRYLKKTLHHTLKRFVYSDFLVRPPVGSDWVPQMSIEERDALFAIEDESVYEPSEEPKFDYLKEIQESDNFTQTEKQILTLRSQGYTQKEIAKELDMSQATVLRWLRGMKNRLRRVFHG